MVMFSCVKTAAQDATTELRVEEKLTIKVALLGGDTHCFEASSATTISDLRDMIHKRLCHVPGTQRLLLGATVLEDSGAKLKDVKTADGSLLCGSPLTLVLITEPLGQQLLSEAHGNMKQLAERGTPADVLNEFQLSSLHAAWKSGGILKYDSDDEDTQQDEEAMPWGHLGHWSIDLYWTTRSDEHRTCRYEYWSSAPGDNEQGALIRIDASTVTAIGDGSDDGLCVYEEFADDALAMQLVHEGWPRFKASLPDDEDEEEED